jgi:hypothetical protein
MISPDQFTTLGVQWVDAGAAVLTEAFKDLGLIAAAAFGLGKLLGTGEQDLRAQLEAHEGEIEALKAVQASALGGIQISAEPAPPQPKPETP